MVDDNFHYMDEDHRYKSGEYLTYNEAVSACKKLIDGELSDMLKQGTDPKELSVQWAMFGEDPFIMGLSEGEKRFSAREYVAEKMK